VRDQLQAQRLHAVCPVSDGEFSSALAGEVDTVGPGGCPVFEEAPDATLPDDSLLTLLLSPGDCPGWMNGDCAPCVTDAKHAPEAAERAAE